LLLNGFVLANSSFDGGICCKRFCVQIGILFINVLHL